MKAINLPETEICKRYQNGESSPALAIFYRVSKPTILKVLKNNGISRRCYSEYSRKLPDEEIISRYQSGETLSEISKDCNCSEWMIKKHLLDSGERLNRTGPRRRLALDESFFEKIDSEEKAYWLGFILADGSIIKTGSGNLVLSIGLKSSDDRHLEKLLRSMQSGALIKYHTRKNGKSLACVTISSTKICNDLINLGCIRRKSWGHPIPNISKDLIRHFIRGFVDGDGSIYKDKKTGKLWGFGIVATLPMLNFIESFFEQNGIKKTKLLRCKNSKCAYRLSSGGNRKNLKILDLLYADASVFLDRKMELYNQLKAQLEKRAYSPQALPVA